MTPRWPSPPPRVAGRDALPDEPPRRRIKILHVITRFAGGAGGNTLLSATGMDPDRYEVWVAAMDEGALWEKAEGGGVRCVPLTRMRERIAPRDDLSVIWELVRLIRRERFTVVHTHCSKAGVIGRVAARLAGTPVVVHTWHLFAANESQSPSTRAAYRAIDRAVRPFAHRYLAVSPRVAREAVETRLSKPGTVTVVPSAVELDVIPDRADDRIKAELGLAADAPVVGWVGRMVAQKAPLDFVRMAAFVRREHPDVLFVMVGDAENEARPLDRETREEAERLDVDILFTGFRNDAPRIAAAFDVSVICSLYEGLGRGLTEAMASARPVVATAVNGVPDLIEHGATGLLVEPSDPAALARAVGWMLEHPRERAQMGAQARARVLGLFDQRTMCAMLDETYAQLLGLPSPSDEGRIVVGEAGSGQGSAGGEGQAPSLVQVP